MSKIELALSAACAIFGGLYIAKVVFSMVPSLQLVGRLLSGE